MTGFAALLAEAEEIEGGFAFDVTDDWLQGRTAYGGLTSALALAAAQRVDPELPPLRSGQFAMIAPLAGRVEARARIVRKGRNATWVAAELSNEKGVGFSASFVFMRQIESAADIAGYPLPEGVSPVADAKPVPMDHAPQFLKQNFDARFALPKSALGEADLCWWVRLRARENLDPALEAVLVGDALPTAVLPLLGFRVPISSMHWHVNLLEPVPTTEDGWWLLRSTSEFARGGGASEQILQWNAAGRPVIAGMQSVAVFG
ncbi:thioesterase family protein [Novosphingobium sp. ST904]|uniref:thioesterase family protein n=1 Tax=Novosphingobium sp. ST904 TaxID=1684385 RepID=UPI0010496035|nr:thioesterase family protein [Novosphingobium sp. ST904]TCM40681.1 acyl-CoA thioesterase [Novosphingobium sp. ST904]